MRSTTLSLPLLAVLLALQCACARPTDAAAEEEAADSSSADFDAGVIISKSDRDGGVVVQHGGRADPTPTGDSSRPHPPRKGSARWRYVPLNSLTIRDLLKKSPGDGSAGSGENESNDPQEDSKQSTSGDFAEGDAEEEENDDGHWWNVLSKNAKRKRPLTAAVASYSPGPPSLLRSKPSRLSVFMAKPTSTPSHPRQEEEEDARKETTMSVNSETEQSVDASTKPPQQQRITSTPNPNDSASKISLSQIIREKDAAGDNRVTFVSGFKKQQQQQQPNFPLFNQLVVKGGVGSYSPLSVPEPPAESRKGSNAGGGGGGSQLRQSLQTLTKLNRELLQKMDEQREIQDKVLRTLKQLAHHV